jgi:hypothetical protein
MDWNGRRKRMVKYWDDNDIGYDEVDWEDTDVDWEDEDLYDEEEW